MMNKDEFERKFDSALTDIVSLPATAIIVGVVAIGLICIGLWIAW